MNLQIGYVNLKKKFEEILPNYFLYTCTCICNLKPMPSRAKLPPYVYPVLSISCLYPVLSISCLHPVLPVFYLYPILHVSCLNTVLPISDLSISYPALFCLCPVLYVSCLYPVLPISDLSISYPALFCLCPVLYVSCPYPAQLVSCLARILPTPILPESCFGLRLNTGRSDKGTQVSITFQRNTCQ